MAGCRGSLCCCCRWCCCCGERETRTPEELTILGETQEEEDEILPRKDYESLDYDRCINDPYLEVLETMDNKKGRRYEAVKWMMVFAIGVSTGLVGLFVDFFARLFTQLKFGVVQASVEECSQKGCLALSLLELMGFNLTFVFFASLLVLIEPVAAGSGIPEIKCYLNGVKVPGIVRLRTLLCKVFGVLFSVAGGKEVFLTFCCYYSMNFTIFIVVQ
uniref:Chloride transport protein 6 isoform 1-like n=1 Tax=Sus scrofa TaxID=9823 RepID=A0A480LS53_PIG